MTGHLTKRLVDSLEAPPPGQRLRVFDDKLNGFYVVVQPTGRKSFGIQYGPAERRQRFTLGQYGALTVEAARTMAQAKLAEVAQGRNPKDEDTAKAAIPTFGEYRDTYLEKVRRRKKQARHDERYLCAAHEPRKHARKVKEGEPEHPIATVIGRWSRKRIDTITRSDVEAGQLAIAERGHTTANRWLASVRACFAAAVKEGKITTNPAEGIEGFREAPPRARVLTDEEFARVVAAFEGIADPHTRAAFVLLMDTGARKSEVLHAAWADIDLDAGLWRIPSPKAGRPQVVPLAEGTVAYLRGVERIGPWFVPGRDAAKPRTDLRRAWDHVREVAAVDGVNIHDLRRTFGLHVAKKAGLHVASKLLRHSNIQVTEKVYAPLGIDDLRTAVTGVHGARGQMVALQGGKRD
jgi:integrase